MGSACASHRYRCGVTELPRRGPSISVLNYATSQDLRVVPFRNTLRALEYVEGKNLDIIAGSTNGIPDPPPKLPAELVTSKVDVMRALGLAACAAKQASL
jgi:hypothetical protein